ncbi:MJ0042 family finger-like domain protein [Asticcacaulis biprosthecium C19]|uniref:MJ0042 family finger-like domain protein n=1 Tax=Asticcacaulis biprosthecium C19 TaxID=715226 RepID=F4QGT0_9CAUL|nr:zinc-ribbon domain-containing protein [Asticcacaulis biprosthecium]EGF92532.1 MJ0042 family finger-like domain protein [Asticcacaulis biprosthecium C19]
MILTCPNCSTRYTLQASQLPNGGRTVRCAACKTTWHAEREEDPIDLPLPAQPAPARAEDLQDVKPRKLPGQYRAMVEDKKRSKELTAQAIVWGAMGLAVVAFLAIGFLFRVDIVRAFPRVAGAYAMVNLKVNATNLDIEEHTADAAFKDGRFVVTINAKITNLVNKPTKVPPMKVKLYDATGQLFDTLIVPSGGLTVEPGATRTLTFDVKDPKNLTANIDLLFDLEAMKQKPSAALRSEKAGHDSDGGHDDPHGATPASEGDDHGGPANDSAGHGNEQAVTGDAAPDHAAAAPAAADHAVAAGDHAPTLPALRSELPATAHDDHAPAAHH